MTKSNLNAQWQRFTTLIKMAITFFQGQWRKYKPEIDKLIRAFIAISAIASTFKIALQTIPIVVSIVTVLATLPLVSYLFPSFFFTTSLNSTLIFSILGVISTIAGYSKYRELILRTDLDNQIKENKQQVENLKLENQHLRERLDNIEAIIFRPHTFLPSNSSFYQESSPYVTEQDVSFVSDANDEIKNELAQERTQRKAITSS